MKSYQSIVISTLALSLVASTGCNLSSTTTTNTNAAATVNTATTNKNAAVVANKTNTSSDTADIDTSDWQTYTNEEYGFSFRYPVEWGSVEAQAGLSAGEVSLLFSNRENATNQYLITPIISVAKENLEGDNDSLPPFDYQTIDFTKSDSKLSEDLKRPGATSDLVTKIKIGNKDAVQIDETKRGLTGKQLFTVFIIVPDFSDEGTHLRVTINGSLTDQLSTFNNTIAF